MKLLVSDYDGTFYTGENDIKINVEIIKKFREQGNLFMLSTGRNYNSIKRQIDKYGIKYDFLSCKDGAILFNEEDSLVHVSLLNIDILRNLLLDLSYIKGIKHIENHGIYGKTTNDDEVIDLFIVTNHSLVTQNIIDMLKIKYPFLSTFTYYGATFIETGDGKVRTIEKVRNITNVEDVITIGDNINDLSMLTNYNGYKVETCFPSLNSLDIPKCENVHSLVKQLIR